ncbi:MAG: lipocalin family protein [Burkholderiales bacterium]|jgi:lipocalin|nr:lipocalin family protein [Burkholderiales bacterium]
MNSRSPASLARTEADLAHDIDARILHAEQRLMAREERLRVGMQVLTRDLRRRLRPRRWLAPAGSAVLVAAALASLLKRPPRGAGNEAQPQPGAGLGALRDLPWPYLFRLAWPLLPGRWRERMGPATASSLVTLGLPLIHGLLDKGGTGVPLPTVAEVDLARFGGRWFLVAELPGPLDAEPLEPPEIGLLPRDDGRFDLLQRRIDRHGTHASESLVQAVAGSRGARLKFCAWPAALQWLSWAWTEQGVLHVDEAYDEAMIGSPSRDSLWLLSRRPGLAPQRREALMQIARERGFAVDRLRFAGASP